MFILTIAKTRKQSKCPSTDECIKKMRCIYMCIYIYIYNVYYAAIKKDEILPFAATWMDLEKNIIQGEISQTEKTNTI